MSDTKNSSGNGTKRPQTRAERREVLSQAEADLTKRRLGWLGLIVVIIGFMLIVGSLLNKDYKPGVELPQTAKQESSSDDPPPLIPVETPSYTRFEIEANRAWRKGNKGPWLALIGQHGFKSLKAAQKAVRQHVEVEAVKGLDFYIRKVGKRGKWVTNTGLRESGYFTLTTKLKPGDKYLTWDKKLGSVPEVRRGKMSIRTACGNAITEKSSKKITTCGPPKPGQGDPEHPLKKGSIGQKVDAHKSSPTKTGSTRGTAEKVTVSQEKNTDTDVPVTGGADADEKAVITGPGDNENGAGDQVNDGVVTDDD